MPCSVTPAARPTAATTSTRSASGALRWPIAAPARPAFPTRTGPAPIWQSKADNSAVGGRARSAPARRSFLPPMVDKTSKAVSFRQVSRHYGEVRAADDVSFDIDHGEFFSMLGPSGSGKTTCLRLIAGFEQPTRGEILIDGKPVAGVPPYERDVNTVFQDYALFPHMSVAENVAYGLMIRRVPKVPRLAKAEE